MAKRNIRIIATWNEKCGIYTFSKDLSTALNGLKNEIGSIEITVNSKTERDPTFPEDLVINRYNPKSWIRGTDEMIVRAHQKGNQTILSQHEFGLDPALKNGSVIECMGTNYVEMAKKIGRNKDILHLVYLHTVPSKEKASKHQIKTLQDLARFSDGLIVTTDGAKEILSSKPYSIAPSKLKHIDHGIRMNNRDREPIKNALEARGVFLATQLGLRSPDKGVQYFIPGVARFVHESLTPSQRENFCGLIAGEYHPEFVRAEGGKYFRPHKEEIDKVLRDSNLRIQEIKNMGDADFKKNDLIILDSFLDDEMLKDLYCATNCMILPYLNMDQISSGILADTLGSGRVAISTKFNYACEMLDYHGRPITNRGILVDHGDPSINQIGAGLDYLVFGKDTRGRPIRLNMEQSSYSRGHDMIWDNIARISNHYFNYVESRKDSVNGRGSEFKRKKPSSLENVL